MIGNVSRMAAVRLGAVPRTAGTSIIRPSTVTVVAARPIAMSLSRSLATKAASDSAKAAPKASATAKKVQETEKAKQAKLKKQAREDREKAKQVAAKEKAKQAKLKEQARKDREKEKEVAAKEKALLRKQQAEEKKRVAREKTLARKEKEKLKKLQAREKAAKAKAEAQAAKVKKWVLIDENGNKVPLPTANKPGRTTPFFEFIKSRPPAAKGVSVIDIAKQGAEAYKALSESEREAFAEAARRHNASYPELLQKWQESLTQQDLARLQAYDEYRAKLAKASGKKRHATVPKSRRTRPKQPAGPFIRYYKDLISQNKVSGRVADATREAGVQWRSLSAEEKKPYEEASRRDVDAYRKELAAWESSNVAV